MSAVGVTGFDGADDGPVPTEFVAVTVNVYATPLVSPETMTGLPEPLPVWPPGDAVTVYELIAAPPFEPGAVKLTVASPSPATADRFVGAPGSVVTVNGSLEHELLAPLLLLSPLSTACQ